MSYCEGIKGSIVGSKNFQLAWIVGSVNQRTSNVTDHAMREQHCMVVSKWHTDSARASQESISTYAAVAKSLLHIDISEYTRLLKKFDLLCILGKEMMAFKKYPVLAKLVKRHGVNIGNFEQTQSTRVYSLHCRAPTLAIMTQVKGCQILQCND